MPHINIHYFAQPIAASAKERISAEITQLIKQELNCKEGVISISICPENPEDWQEKIYLPNILERKNNLIKIPNYKGDK